MHYYSSKKVINLAKHVPVIIENVILVLVYSVSLEIIFDITNFKNVRNSIIREEESSQQEISTAEIASTSASTSNSVPEDEQFISMVTTTPSLSHEQKEHIRDVEKGIVEYGNE